MTQTIEIEDIKRLRLELGDHLLVTLPADAMDYEFQWINEVFKELWPGVPVVIVVAPIEVQAVSA